MYNIPGYVASSSLHLQRPGRPGPRLLKNSYLNFFEMGNFDLPLSFNKLSLFHIKRRLENRGTGVKRADNLPNVTKVTKESGKENETAWMLDVD